MQRALVRGIVVVSALLVIHGLPMPAAIAQTTLGAFDPYPLRPPDTSSPRDTIESFLTNTRQAAHAWRSDQPREAVIAARERIRETLDFSQLPARGRIMQELEAILLLAEILGRIELPPSEEIPGDTEVLEQELTSWAIPNTRITLAKMEEGPQAGEFLFTADTVRNLEYFYRRAKNLPYKPDALVGIYEEAAYSPGPIVPLSWFAGLPGWLKIAFLGAALWQWLSLALLSAVTFFVVLRLVQWGRSWDRRHRTAGTLKRLGTPFAVLASIFVVLLCKLIFVHIIQLITDWWVAIDIVLWSVIFGGIGWLIALMIDRLADAVNQARQVKEGSIDSQLVRTLFRLLSLVFLAFLVLYAASFLGLPLTPVAASLGIGGLAIALAVRPTLENIIGGLTLFADKPVRIGEFCRFGSEYGTVEEIGLRSTRLRKLDDTVVSVPNADFSQRELTNYARRRQRLVETTLGLRYETTAEQLRYVMTRLREMLLGHPKVSKDFLHVRFASFGAYSLDIEVFAYLRTSGWLEYKAIREDINLRIMEIVQEAGTGFAFPSQTAYLSRDTGLDAERREQVESKVQAWRLRGQLPFPDFDEGQRWEKQDILDYPPEGSPDHKPRSGGATPAVGSKPGERN